MGLVPFHTRQCQNSILPCHLEIPPSDTIAKLLFWSDGSAELKLMMCKSCFPLCVSTTHKLIIHCLIWHVERKQSRTTAKACLFTNCIVWEFKTSNFGMWNDSHTTQYLKRIHTCTIKTGHLWQLSHIQYINRAKLSPKQTDTFLCVCHYCSSVYCCHPTHTHTHTYM